MENIGYHTPFTTVCAWCPDAKEQTEAARALGFVVSHGICGPCAKTWERDMSTIQTVPPVTSESIARAKAAAAAERAEAGVVMFGEREPEWPAVGLMDRRLLLSMVNTYGAENVRRVIDAIREGKSWAA